MNAPALKETPEQEAMRLEAQRAREEQFRKLEADKNIAPSPPEFSEPFIFRFRMWKNGSFSGLWQLEALNKYGKLEELITDADTLPNVLDQIGNIFANRGY